MVFALRTLIVLFFLVVAFLSGVIVSDAQNRARIASLDAQLDTVVEMQNTDKDRYESALAAINASLAYQKRREFFRGAFDFCSALYDPAECLQVVQRAAATQDFYEQPSPGFEYDDGQHD